MCYSLLLRFLNAAKNSPVDARSAARTPAAAFVSPVAGILSSLSVVFCLEVLFCALFCVLLVWVTEGD